MHKAIFSNKAIYIREGAKGLFGILLKGQER
jgi:hypothetical protein